jgi:hypothetical protein
MVEAAELPRAFDGHDVRRLLHDAHHVGIASRVGADGADLALRQVEAALAEADLVLHVLDGRRERQDVVGPESEDVEREPLGRARAYPRQLGELCDQPFDGR